MRLRHPWHTWIGSRGGAGLVAIRASSDQELEQRRELAHRLAAWAWSRPGASSSDASPDARTRGEVLEQFRAAG